MGYGIGLDIGIASVGFGVVALDSFDEPCGILKLGARIFTAAEVPKTGASLAKPRRDARGARRRLRRHNHRIERIKNLLCDFKILTNEELDNLFFGRLEDIYKLRTRALDEKVDNKEFARILLHLAQRRGFKSNRKIDKDDKEAGKLLSSVSENAKRMNQKGYRTVGEMFYRDEIFEVNKRNKSSNYISTVQREMIADEVEQIFASQKSFDNIFATEEFKTLYLKILLSQRPFELGPGGNSPYGGNQIENRIGRCTFEKSEKRAAKACYSFERFNLLQKVNNLRLVCKGLSTPLSEEQRNKIVELAHNVADLSYGKIRKELNLSSNNYFNSISYRTGLEESEKKEKFNYLQSYHQMRKAFDKIARGHITTIDKHLLNIAGYILTIHKTDEKIINALKEEKMADEDIEALLTISGFSKFGHLSIKACEKIIPFLEQGMNYDEACTNAGYDFRGHNGNEKSFFLPAVTEDMDMITSPVVRRAIAQTIKVINALIREQKCSPSFVNIELAREMAKDFEERKKLEQEMHENQARNARLIERIRKEFGKANPTGQDLVKLKLYEEQSGVCLYSQKT